MWHKRRNYIDFVKKNIVNMKTLIAEARKAQQFLLMIAE
jgi:hypothetical protein